MLSALLSRAIGTIDSCDLLVILLLKDAQFFNVISIFSLLCFGNSQRQGLCLLLYDYKTKTRFFKSG